MASLARVRLFFCPGSRPPAGMFSKMAKNRSDFNGHLFPNGNARNLWQVTGALCLGTEFSHNEGRVKVLAFLASRFYMVNLPDFVKRITAEGHGPYRKALEINGPGIILGILFLIFVAGRRGSV